MAFTVTPAHTSDEAWKVTPNLHKCGNVIGMLRARNVRQGEICKNEFWRIDGQNTDGFIKNLQIQRNGIWQQKSSIAGVLFSGLLLDKIGSISQVGPEGEKAKLRDHELTTAIHKALTESAGSWSLNGPSNNIKATFKFFEIKGGFSA